MEVSHVRKRLLMAIDRARKGAQARRQRAADTERAYDTFLAEVATPVARMLVTALKAEGYGFTVNTPGGGLRLVPDRGRDDFIDLALDTTVDPPEVMARISYERGSRTITNERAITPGAPPQSITDEDVLAFLLEALTPWLER
ncbi:MAG TPA: hypothetical protein VGQ10_15765 [Vicinamibacterales bacterium]|nr:hypothetical protein [Vicinamibacterales bacterium]